MQKTLAQSMCYCAILTALAVLFQSSPVFLPIVGLALSPLATVPAALAFYQSKSLGFALYFATGLILLLIYPQEAIIFLLTTGIIGLPLGVYSQSVFQSVAISAGVLFAGMNALTYFAGISIFGDITPDASFWDSFLLFLLFSLGYAAIWHLVIKAFIKMLVRLRIISNTERGRFRSIL